jgi:hypothetical protein
MDFYTHNALFIIMTRIYLYRTIYGRFQLIQVYTIEDHLYSNDYTGLP